MKVTSQNKQQDQPLDLIQFLKGLYEAGRISREELQKLVKARKSPKQHVLVFIANKNIEDLKSPGKTLDLESLTQILAEQTDQDYYHVDPLSIDAAKVTEVMSHAFAKRHKIMAVKVDSNEVSIASAEPNISSWEEDLNQAWKGEVPTEVFVEQGCRECRDTGFQGREGIYEVMLLSEELQTYAEDRADLPKLRQQAYQEGMSSLRHSGAMKVAAGITTINEVFRVAPEAK